MFNKKAIGFILYFGIFFLLATFIIIFSLPKVDIQGYIGLKQYSILSGNEEVEAAKQYIDLSAQYSAQIAKELFLERGGVYYQLGDQATNSWNRCGRYIYNNYNSKTRNCIPDFAGVYRNYFTDEFRGYLSAYEKTSLFAKYELGLESQEDQTILSLSSNHPLKYNLQTFSSTIGYAQSSIFGSYGNEKTISCAHGNCVSDAALHLYNIYSNNGQQLVDYVWGGESPYSYEDTIALQSIDNSIFDGVSVTRTQPGYSTFTRAGFDCSGWTWWVGEHTGIEAFSVRRSAQEYYDNATNDAAQLICGENNPCLLPTIIELGEPGDIFYHSGDGSFVGHMGIYIGDGQIIHSKGAKSGGGLIVEDIPTTYAGEDETKIIGLYRYPYDSSGLVAFPESELVSSQPGLLTEDQRESLIVELAATLKIEPAVALAVFEVETGGKAGLCEDGRPLIRFEPHIFCQEGGDASWCQGANTNDQRRANFIEEGFSHGSNCRTNQVEWDSLAYAKEINPDAAYRSISTGVAQIMGFNHEIVGYANGKALHDAYAISEEAQIRGFFEFVKNNNQVKANDLTLLEAARTKDFPAFAQIYNGQHASCVSPLVGRKCYKDQLADAYEDYAAEELSALPFSTRSSYIEFSPRVETTVDFDLAAFTSITEEFLSSLDECKDDLDACVAEKIDEFNGDAFDEPTNFVELPEDEGLAEPSIENFVEEITDGEANKKVDFAKTNGAYDLVEQILDCSLHSQSSCYCQLDIDNSTDYKVRIDDGRVFYNGEELLGLDVAVGNVSEEVIIQVDGGVISFESETQEFIVENNIVGISLNKTEEENLSWIALENSERGLVCADPKNYYRFDAFIDEIDNPLQFSYYLEDTTAPQELEFSAKQKICSNGFNATLLSWSVPKTMERLYAFDMVIEESTSSNAASHTALAELFSSNVPDDISVLDKLYRKEGESSYSYYYLVDDARLISSFEPGTSYYYKVVARDHYGNVDFNIDFKEYRLQDTSLDFLSQTLGFNLGEASNFISEGFNYGPCLQAEAVEDEDGSFFDGVLDIFS